MDNAIPIHCDPEPPIAYDSDTYSEAGSDFSHDGDLFDFVVDHSKGRNTTNFWDSYDEANIALQTANDDTTFKATNQDTALQAVDEDTASPQTRDEDSRSAAGNETVEEALRRLNLPAVQSHSPNIGELHDSQVHFPDHFFGDSTPEQAEQDSSVTLRFFLLFFSHIVVENIVCNTNAYAVAHGGALSGRPWNEVSIGEFYIFLGLLIYKGVFAPLGKLSEVWNQTTQFPHHDIRKFMTLTRFQQIKRFLHLSPSWDQHGRNFFDKLEPLFSQLHDAFQKHYRPSSNVSIDEMMIRFTGRSHHLHIIKNKPIPRGYQVLALCDHGYLFASFFHSAKYGFQGAFPTYSKSLQLLISLGLPKRTRIGTRKEKPVHLEQIATAFSHLAKKLPWNTGLQFIIYCDNLFSNIPLFWHLWKSHRIAACGTTRVTSAKYPKKHAKLDKTKSKLPFGFTTSKRKWDDTVTSFVWQDRNLVRFLTTAHNPAEQKQAGRRRPNTNSRDKRYQQAVEQVFGSSFKKTLNQPAIAVDYNNYMGGVDIADQYRASFNTQLRSLRTWYPLFFWLLDSAVINSFLLCKMTWPNSKKDYIATQRGFRIKLAWNLIEHGFGMLSHHHQRIINNPLQQSKQRQRNRRNLTKNSLDLPACRMLPGNHKIVTKFSRNQNERQKYCFWCLWRIRMAEKATGLGIDPEIRPPKSARRTVYGCTVCSDVALCKNGCFEQFHQFRRRS